MQWLAVAVVGTVLASACSSSDDRSVTPVEIGRITPSNSAGSAGSESIVEVAGAGASSAGATGEAGAENIGGYAGGAECEGNYECPEVLYWSYAIIKVELPIPAAAAAAAEFTACRNDECHSAKGSGTVIDPMSVDPGWVYTNEGGTVFLSFDDSGTTPYAVLKWNFTYDGPTPSDASDQYSLTVQPSAAAAPSTLFDERVHYTIEVVDQNAAFENYCSHCYEVSAATVDARAEH
jgi:hypothetical protein